MSMRTCASAWAALFALSCPVLTCAQEWTEAQVIEKFLSDSPYAREARARAATAQADAAGRTLLANPRLLASREGAGYAAFFQVEQQLPLSGRRSLLQQAGTAAVQVTEAESANLLWALRTDLRFAFYRLVAAQRRESVINDSIRELDGVINVLRTREREGEGSRFDRLRAERELAEYRSQIAITQSDIVQARASLAAFLTRQAAVDRVAGTLETPQIIPNTQELLQRALAHRPEFITEQKQVERSRLEARAAGRLRYPEPLAIAGVKRGEIGPGQTRTAPAVAVNIPLPIFNKGQTEVERWRAEEERALARGEALERRITAEVSGAVEALQLRKNAIEQYRAEVNQIGLDLTKIARVSYEEGEIGILELLDSYRINRQAQLRLVDHESMAKEAQIALDRAVGEEVNP